LAPMVLGLALLALASACAGKKPMKDAKAAEKKAAVADSAMVSERDSANYIVKRGDSLWAIAARASVFDDPFKWPLLYRQNRDQIVDPDFIEIRQDLKYKRLHRYSKEEVEDAVKKAKETPPYEPRDKPRKVLPIAY
jgi:hypothetical protein